MRWTLATQRVLSALLAAGGEHYGREIATLSGLPSGTVYPILERLVREGWMESRREDINPREAGRPARTYYKLTETGSKLAQERLEQS